MKHLVSSLAILLPSLVLASNTPLAPGRYSYKDFSVTAKKRFEIVQAMTSPGKERLKELKNNQYNCQHMMDEAYLCSFIFSGQGMEREISARVEKELSNSKLEVFDAQSEPEMMTSRDDSQEWKVPQKVQFNGQEFSSYVLVRGKDFEKVSLGKPVEETFFLNDKKEIKYPSTINVPESKTSYYLYFLMSTFR